MPRSRDRHMVLHLQHQRLTEKHHAPMVSIGQLADATIEKMADLTRRDTSTTCGPNDTGPACHRAPSTTTTVTIPVAVGVAYVQCSYSIDLEADTIAVFLLP